MLPFKYMTIYCICLLPLFFAQTEIPKCAKDEEGCGKAGQPGICIWKANTIGGDLAAVFKCETEQKKKECDIGHTSWIALPDKHGHHSNILCSKLSEGNFTICCCRAALCDAKVLQNNLNRPKIERPVPNVTENSPNKKQTSWKNWQISVIVLAAVLLLLLVSIGFLCQNLLELQKEVAVNEKKKLTEGSRETNPSHA